MIQNNSETIAILSETQKREQDNWGQATATWTARTTFLDTLHCNWHTTLTALNLVACHIIKIKPEGPQIYNFSSTQKHTAALENIPISKEDYEKSQSINTLP